MEQNNRPETSPTQLRRQRLDRRRSERRIILSFTSLFGLGFALGLIGSLYFAWLIYPLNPPVGSPADFLPRYKSEYVYMVSQAYGVTNDFDAARRQLDLLQDPDIAQYTVQTLDEYLRSGQPADAVRDMARLAQALGAEGRALDIFAPTPIGGGVIEVLPTVTPTPDEQANRPTPTLLPSPTPILPNTPIPPTPTPLRPEEAPFQLLAQTEGCIDPSLGVQIGVYVVDENESPLPLTEVLVEWDSGSDRFITGFKPEFGEGYADFAMEEEGVSYAVSLIAGSETVSGLTAEPCTQESGEQGLTNWELTFQAQPES